MKVNHQDEVVKVVAGKTSILNCLAFGINCFLQSSSQPARPFLGRSQPLAGDFGEPLYATLSRIGLILFLKEAMQSLSGLTASKSFIINVTAPRNNNWGNQQPLIF